MGSSQQADTQRYFHASAQDWQRKGAGEAAARVNIIAQRNGIVLDVLAGLDAPRRALDIGCGTGDLVFEMARRGVGVVGIDFAADMIRLCEEGRDRHGLPGARFEHVSVFDFDARGEAYDLVSAQGLIEYISPQELVALCRKVALMLAPGGAFVVGSRNRLFNAFSLNAFTELERGLGVLDGLLGEAAALAGAPDARAALAAAEKAAQPDPQPDRHPTTGVTVALRYQYTPGELARLLGEHGFVPQVAYGAHYHGLPPAVAAEWPELHTELAETVYRQRRGDHRLLPLCSTFVLDVRKPA